VTNTSCVPMVAWNNPGQLALMPVAMAEPATGVSVPLASVALAALRISNVPSLPTVIVANDTPPYAGVSMLPMPVDAPFLP
jgi:hypothetical protein